ncbi:hypothetical protein ACRRTK_013123 [Alexandromys fortis]
MEASEPTHPTPPASDQSAPAPGVPGVSGGQASPRLTLGPVILPPEQGLPPTVFLKALPVPLYHTVPPGGLQPRAPLVTGSLEGASVPFILSPLLQPEGPSPTQMGKPATPALTVNIVGTLPVLSPGVGSTLVSTGRLKNAGKYLCPHCGRDCLKPSVLEKHIRSHTGERPFPCTTCGIAFKTQSNLYKHRRTQTHLNNSRLSLESEGSGSSLLGDGDRPGETTSLESRGDEGAPESALSPGAHPTLATRNRERMVEAAPSLGTNLAHKEAPVDHPQMVSPEFPLVSPQPRRKLPESKPSSLQRQQETCSEKPWDSKAVEGQLRKCESTDSGYLSRSDSVEQPPVASSPLHSLSEHSAESEGEGGPGGGSAGNRAEQGTRGSSLELEKKRLEERIAQLISHNQAVVDDPQLDHVRPRKTVLSKQGSIDLPMPYTYKDSFHFDIRALEPNRRRAALSPARSTFTPLEETRPLFFHSVPTQLSTTVECVPVTRSNSLPFIEGSKLWPESRDPQDAFPLMRKSLSPRLTPARLGDHPGLTLTGIPSGHPRALVRQAAVEDLPCTPTGDPSAVAEDPDGTQRSVVKEGMACRGRASKKYRQKKQKMFSQEKWQVYGNETFKRIYQKMKASHQGGQKHRDVKQGQGSELDLPSQEEVVGADGAGLSQDNRVPVLGDATGGAKPGPLGSWPSLEGSLETEFPKQLKAVARAKSSPTLGSTDTLCLNSKSPLLSPHGKSDLGSQLPPEPVRLQGRDLKAPGVALPDRSGEVTKETCPGDQTLLRRPSDGSVGLQLVEDKLPSERKRLKVEGLDHQEQPGPLEAEPLGSSVWADSQPPQKQDSTSEEVLDSSNKGIQHVTMALESSNASSAVAAVALRWPGLGDKDPTLPSVPKTPGLHSLLPAQLQDPGIPAAVSSGSFAPKYLLRLPQGEKPSPQVAPGPGKDPDSLCTSAQPEEQALLAESELGVNGPPRASSGPAEAGGIPEDPSWSRSMDGREETQTGREKRDRTNSNIPTAELSSDPNTGTTQETASVLPAHTCDTHVIKGVVNETRAICCLCIESPPAKARIYDNLLNTWTSSQKLGSPKNALERPSSETEERLPAYFPSQAHYFFTSFTRPPGLPLGQQKLDLSHHEGTPKSCEAPSSFPSLKAEPQLTWCCLNSSLALPAEQQKAAPRDLASPSPDGSLQVSGTRAQDQVSSPQRKKGLCHRRVKISHEISKKKKLRLHSKRLSEYGLFLFLEWFFNLHPIVGNPDLRALEDNIVFQDNESCEFFSTDSEVLVPLFASVTFSVAVASDWPCWWPLCLLPRYLDQELANFCCENQVMMISDGKPHRPYGKHSTTLLEKASSSERDVSPSAGERNDCSQEKDHANGSGQSLPSNVCLTMFQEDPLPQGKGSDVGPPGTPLPPSQDQVSIVASLCISPDDSKPPPSLRSKGTFPHCDIATSVAAICVPTGTRTGHRTLGGHSVESHMEETLAQSSPDRRAIPESIAQALLPRRPSPSPISPGRTRLEMLPSGPGSTSSHQEEVRPQADFPSWTQYGHREVSVPCAALGSESGTCRTEEFVTPKSVVAPSDQGQPSEVSEAPLKSIRKRSLEGMRKQTRVELSDTSSDDEDRLVIEV